MENMIDCVVIGGGLSGLACAYVLGRRGESVVVVEKSERVGGVIRSVRRDGYLCEAGPNSMLVKSPAVWDLLQELGLGESLCVANEQANKRFLVRDGRLLAMPASPWSAVTTPLWRLPAKLRLLAEPFIARCAQTDESVASFVTRRMGVEFLDYGISALVSGIFAGDPARLSIRHAFPKVWNLEQRFGSLIRGAVGLGLERKRSGVRPFRNKMVSFRAGLEELPTALLRRGQFEAVTCAAVTHLRRAADGHWQIALSVNGGTRSLRARRLILATPLGAYRDLPTEGLLGERLRTLPAVAHPPLSTLVLGFPRSAIAHPLDGFGALFPRRENRFALGVIFSSTLFPGRAPVGKVSLMCFIGGRTQPEHSQLPTDQLVERTVRDLTPLLGIRGQPELVDHHFWPQAIPQYDVGYAAFLAALDAIEQELPGLRIAGNFRGGPGLNDCLASALALDSTVSGPAPA